MAVWGIGAYYSNSEPADKTKDFIENNCACIGWNKDDAPSLHFMFDSIKAGDIIYIKSFTPKTKELHIKAVGLVNDTTKKHYDSLGTGVRVIWKENFQPFSISVDDKMYKNNVFNNTLFEEFNTNIIEKIIKSIMN